MKKTNKPGWRDLIRMPPQSSAPTNGHHDPAPEMEKPVVFDAADGKKRVLITINAEGQFEPTHWFAMQPVDGDNGLMEAAVVCQHAGLILQHEAWGRCREADQLRQRQLPLEGEDGS